MLFKRNDRSFKFCLLGLDYVEYNEISKIITENGGELCDSRNPPVITFSSSNMFVDGGPVFHINYIRECLRHGQLLDLVQFKFGCQKFAGCLMSIFIRGTNICPSINDIGPCCWSTAIEPRDEAHRPIYKEHNYAQGDCPTEQESNTCSDMPLTALNSSSQDSLMLPAGSPRDSEFLPDSLPQATELPSDGSPRDSEFLPDDSPQDSLVLPAGPSQDPEFLTDASPRDSEFLPNDSSRDSAVSTVVTSRDSEFLPDESPPALDFSLRGSPRDPQFPADGFALATEFPPDKSHRDSDLSPDKSPPVIEFSLDGSPRDSEFLPDDSPSALALVCDESPRDSEFLPDQSSSSIGTIVPETPERVPNTTEDDSHLEIPDPASFEELICCRSTHSPVELSGGDTNLCGRSSATSVDTVIITGRNGNPHSPPQLPSDDEIPCKRLPRTCSQDTLIITNLNSKERASPSSNVNGTDLLNDTEEEIGCGEDAPEMSVEREDQILLEAKLRRLKSSKPITPERAMSPIFKLRKIVRKPPETETIVDDQQTIDKGSRTLISPTILRDESNKVKILGRATTEALRNVENFRLTSSDSDDTVYIPSPAVNDCVPRKPEDLSLAFRGREFNRKKMLKKNRKTPSPVISSDVSEDAEAIGVAHNHERTGEQTTSGKDSDKTTLLRSPESNSRKKISKRGREMPGPASDSDSEDAEENEVVNNNVRSNIQTRLGKSSNENGYRSSTRLNARRVANHKKNTAVDATRSSDDIISISNHDSDSSSESEVASPSSHRAARNKSLLKKTSSQKQNQNQNAVVKRNNRLQPLSRNFLPWEQREIVKYLIDKEFISEAKGNRVWKQMIQDGFLSHRTYQSLNNHFRKYILPHIQRFPMKSESLKKFQALLP